MNPRKPRRLCLNCRVETGRPFYIYCSTACQMAYEYKKRVEIVLSTGDVSAGFKAVKSAKAFLLSQDGHRCAICGRVKWRGQPVPLVMDHRDGNPYNWKRSNLRLICGNCDMQLPTYKGKNRGKGRAVRRQRYAEGKTY